MLSQEIEERLAEVLVNRIEEVNAYILEQIGKTIKEIGSLKPSDAYRLGQIIKYRW